MTKSNDVALKYAWDKALAYNNDSIAVVEVPILSYGQFGFSDDTLSADELNTNEQAVGSTTRLVIVAHPNGKINCRLMTIIPDSPYPKTLNDISFNTYLTKANTFTGSVLFSYPNGQFTNGWYFENGVVKKSISPNTGEIATSASKEAMLDCNNTTVYHYERDCTDWSVNGAYSWSSCGSWYYVVDYTYTRCPTGGSGGSGGFEDPQEVENPITENIDNPCEQMKQAASASDFKWAIDKLLKKTTTNPEVGYMLTINSEYSVNSTIYNYKYMIGSSEKPEINIWNYLKTGDKIDGFMHTHYNSVDPMFSADDIALAIQLYTQGYVTDLSTFSIGLVTPNSTYFVKVDDLTTFANFYNAKLSTKELCDNITSSIAGWYKKFGADGAEKGFLDNFANSGLKLFKRKTDGTFKQQAISSSGSVIGINCN